MRVSLVIALVAPLALLLGACDRDPDVDAADDGSPSVRFEGELATGDETHPDDGSFYDAHAFRARQGQRVSITMTSSEVDSYLHLFDEQGSEITQNDDYTGDSRDARIVFAVQQDGVFTVWATSREATDTGPYTVTVERMTP